MKIKIWQRYFIKEILKVFFLFLFCFYGLYILIDYSSHSGSFHHNHSRFDWMEFLFYYGSEFVHRSDVLIPFALLIATIRTLTKCNQNLELTALRAAGIPLLTLMSPFIFLGLFFTCLCYVNEQWILPESMNMLKRIQDTHSTHKRKQNKNLAAQHLILKDESTLIYQNYDTSKGLFFDVYWVRSAGDLYQIKSLNPNSEIPLGINGYHLTRDAEGILRVVETFQNKEFPDMSFNKKMLLETITPIEDLSLSKLWEKWPDEGVITSDKEARIVTAFYRKLASPWLCFIAMIVPIPFCVRFNRYMPIFLIYALNIFGLAAIYLILDSAQVLGKRQIMDPAVVIWVPFLFFFSIFTMRMIRLK